MAIEKVYGISEVSDKFNIPVNTLRQWESTLKGILVINRDHAGNRYYTEENLRMIRKIKQMREDGLTFDAIRRRLRQEESDQSDSTYGSMEQDHQASIEPSSTKLAPDDLRNLIERYASDLRTALIEEIRREVREEVRQEIKAEFETFLEEIRREMRQSSEATSAVISEVAATLSRQERHKKRSFWSRIFGQS
jgi:DNA-binding transcriptional MerR regulator